MKDAFYRREDFDEKFKYKDDDSETISHIKAEIRLFKHQLERSEQQFAENIATYNEWLSDKYTMMKLIQEHPWPFKYIFQAKSNEKKYIEPENYTQEQKNQLVKRLRDDILEGYYDSINEKKAHLRTLKAQFDEITKKEKQIKEPEIQKKLFEETQYKAKKDETKKRAEQSIGRQLLYDEELDVLFTKKSGKVKPTAIPPTVKPTPRTTKRKKEELKTKEPPESWRTFVSERKKHVLEPREALTIPTLIEEIPHKKYTLAPIDPKSGKEYINLSIRIPKNVTKVLGRNDWPTISNNFVSREAIEVTNNGEELLIRAVKQQHASYSKVNGETGKIKTDYIHLDEGDIIIILKDVLVLKVLTF
jgi:hypothetical protein